MDKGLRRGHTYTRDSAALAAVEDANSGSAEEEAGTTSPAFKKWIAFSSRPKPESGGRRFATGRRCTIGSTQSSV